MPIYKKIKIYFGLGKSVEMEIIYKLTKYTKYIARDFT